MVVDFLLIRIACNRNETCIAGKIIKRVIYGSPFN